MTDLKPVLTWVNQEREKRGMEPLERLPKGQPKNFRLCPIALAVAALVFDVDWQPPLPSSVRQFIADFDNGKYPELVA